MCGVAWRATLWAEVPTRCLLPGYAASEQRYRRAAGIGVSATPPVLAPLRVASTCSGIGARSTAILTAPCCERRCYSA